jgi:murein DD-endopeptidase MepM/ murein hydrolase activator NlpD
VIRAALFAFLLAAAPAMADTITGHATPGGLLVVTPPAGSVSVRLNGVPLARTATGTYLAAFGRDETGEARLEAVQANGQASALSLPLKPRSFRVQRLPALGTTNDPAPEWVARRKLEAAAINAAKLAAAADPGASAGWAQPFLRPATGRISGVYGSQRVYGGLPRSPHWGLDIAAPTGTPVLAPADGIVRLSAGPYLLEGNIVILDHGAGILSSMIHLNARDVKAGARVKRGDRVGTVGTTGRSTGPHLHWGVSLVRPAPNDDPKGFTDTRLDPALLLVSPMPTVAKWSQAKPAARAN